MEIKSQRPIDRFVKRSQSILQKEYVVIGKRRISSFTAWAVIAFFVGITIAVAFLASRTGTFEGSEAARVPKPVWSSWGNWQEGSSPSNAPTVQYRSRTKTSAQIVNGKKTRVRAQGYEQRQCVKNCESLEGAQFQQQQGQQQSSATIKLDLRYLRGTDPQGYEYFHPQATGLGYHKEIKPNHFAEDDFSKLLLRWCLNGNYPSETSDPQTSEWCSNGNGGTPIAPTSYDPANKIVTWQVPKANRNYFVQFKKMAIAVDGVVGIFRTCPADTTKPCRESLDYAEAHCGTGCAVAISTYNSKVRIRHSAGESTMTKVFGITGKAFGYAGFMTGKGGVWFYGQEGNSIPVANAATPGWFHLNDSQFNNFEKSCFSQDGCINFNPYILAGRFVFHLIFDTAPKPKFAAELPFLSNQVYPNSTLATDCSETIFTNVSQSSPMGELIAETFNDILDQLKIFRIPVIYNTPMSLSTFPINYSGSGCTVENGCGSNQPTRLYIDPSNVDLFNSAIAKSDTAKRFAEVTGVTPTGVGGFTRTYGVGNASGNDVATISMKQDIVVKSGFNLSDWKERGAQKDLLCYELMHLFVGRGWLRSSFVETGSGKCIIPDEVAQTVQSAYPHCANLAKQDQTCKAIPLGHVGDACHPGMAVEQ